MVIEIISGFVFGSMALLADGWHMASHAAALSITVIAYYFARRLSSNPRFSFGTGKIGELAGYSSAILLLLIALLVAYESFHRFVAPVQISFDEAIFVAIIGLAVNIVSAFILKEKPHAHQHGHHHHQHDNNIRAAYLHVLADALTSILAIVALITGRFWNWVWMDPMMGIVGAVVITRWSIQLLRDSGKILLDVTPDEALIERIRTAIDSNTDSCVSDLHLWQVGPNQFSAIITITSTGKQTPDDYKKQIAGICELQHITIEINPESPV
jgi:cation diffusion facilitator family transporter